MSRGWGVDTLPDSTSLQFAHEVVTLYARPGGSRVIYLQNAGDVDHVEKHFAPFHRAVHPKRNLEYLLHNFGPGQVSADYDSLVRMLTVLRDIEDWDEVVTPLRGLTINRNR